MPESFVRGFASNSLPSFSLDAPTGSNRALIYYSSPPSPSLALAHSLPSPNRSTNTQLALAMASSAALMQGLQSFDSSDAGAESRIGGGVTLGGITLGSVAPSFHSEDEDDAQAGGGGGARWQSKGKGREQYAEEESSILDEEEMTGAGGDSGTGDEEGYILPSQQQSRPAAPAARPASNSSRPASSASRYPSASTQATTAPSPQPRRPLPSSLVDLGHHSNSRLDDSDEREREQSGMLRELNMDESRDSGRWSGVKGANGAGKKKGGGVGQNMTLREQEKVSSGVNSSLSQLD